MQKVIDIDDRVYGLLKYFEKGMGLNDRKDSSEDDVKTALIRAVVNGTPLPKGHGRLIDADALYDEYVKEPEEFNGGHSLVALFRAAPTIIEADTA